MSFTMTEVDDAAIELSVLITAVVQRRDPEASAELAGIVKSWRAGGAHLSHAALVALRASADQAGKLKEFNTVWTRAQFIAGGGAQASAGPRSAEL
jgi:hypothetical protein